MSMMGELKFFFGLQINQTLHRTFISQIKYSKELLKNFWMNESKLVGTPMCTSTKLDKDEDGQNIDKKII